jgi:hypothetical protein
MVHQTKNRSYMKKRSKWIPEKVIKKKESMDKSNSWLKNKGETNISPKSKVINYTETSIT